MSEQITKVFLLSRLPNDIEIDSSLTSIAILSSESDAVDAAKIHVLNQTIEFITENYKSSRYNEKIHKKCLKLIEDLQKSSSLKEVNKIFYEFEILFMDNKLSASYSVFSNQDLPVWRSFEFGISEYRVGEVPDLIDKMDEKLDQINKHFKTNKNKKLK